MEPQQKDNKPKKKKGRKDSGFYKTLSVLLYFWRLLPSIHFLIGSDQSQKIFRFQTSLKKSKQDRWNIVVEGDKIRDYL